MMNDFQTVLAVWAVLTIPFALVTGYLWSQGELRPRFVAAYWFPPTVLTILGVIPAPWQPVVG